MVFSGPLILGATIMDDGLGGVFSVSPGKPSVFAPLIRVRVRGTHVLAAKGLPGQRSPGNVALVVTDSRIRIDIFRGPSSFLLTF